MAQPHEARRPGSGPDSSSMIDQQKTRVVTKAFDEATIEAVWNGAAISSEHPPLRVDPYGALIWRGGYRNTSSKFGWEIGYRTSPSRGGTDDVANLQALQWENFRLNGHS